MIDRWKVNKYIDDPRHDGEFTLQELVDAARKSKQVREWTQVSINTLAKEVSDLEKTLTEKRMKLADLVEDNKEAANDHRDILKEMGV